MILVHLVEEVDVGLGKDGLKFVILANGLLITGEGVSQVGLGLDGPTV